MGQYVYPADRPTSSTILHPDKWVRLEADPVGIRATCIACDSGRTFPTMDGREVFLDEISEAMTDHVLRNHGAA